MNQKILIADDALFMRTMLRRVLEKEGYGEIIEAGDGEAAVEACRRERPAIVLMDISMPKMGGLEALRAISQEGTAGTIIMCSAIGQDAMIVEALEAGAADFIVKPFRPEQIVRAVDRAIEACGGENDGEIF